MKPQLRTLVAALTLTLVASSVMDAAEIHRSTYTLGQRDDGKIHAWVFLSHKPAALGKEQPSIAVSAKAQDRRWRRGQLAPAQTLQLDQPVAVEFVQQIQRSGIQVRQVSRWLNAVSVSATREQLELVAQLPFVTGIEPVRRMVVPPPPEPAPIPLEKVTADTRDSAQELFYGPSYQQLALMNVPAVHDLGYSGKGITILMLDSGFYQDHESIDPERIIAEKDFLFDDSNTQDQDSRDTTLSGSQHDHGTKVYTALGGYSPGKLIGPAYDCSFLLAKTESEAIEDTIEEDYYVAGLEWGEAQGADIVSSSLGYMDWYQYEDMDGQTAVTTKAVIEATRLGVLVVTAASNERNNTSWGGYIIAPGDADSVLTVGAVDNNGYIASFSSHGPTSDGRIKPEVVAPGVSVYCASPTGKSNYTYASGTSLATPLVAGSAALLLEAHPDWGPEDVRIAIMATASRASQPDYDYGWGIPDLSLALKYSGGIAPNVNTLAIGEIYPNPFPAGERLSILIPVSMPVESAHIDIINLLGQHIVQLDWNITSPIGPAFATWDGLDKRGMKVPSGTYFVVITARNTSVSRRITVLY